MGGLGLADARDVVLPALDGHQADVGDGGQVDFAAAMLEQAARQQVLLDDDVDGPEVEPLAQVQPRGGFVVEGLVLLGGVAVARDQMTEIVAVGEIGRASVRGRGVAAVVCMMIEEEYGK